MVLEGVVRSACLNAAAGVWKIIYLKCFFTVSEMTCSRIFQLLFILSIPKIETLITWLFLPVFILFRWKQTLGTAVPSRLGLDLAGERILRCRRRGKLPGGGPQAERIPGRDIFHRLVLLCLFLFEWRPFPVCHIRPPGLDGAEHWVHTQDETASICLPLQLRS